MGNSGTLCSHLKRVTQQVSGVGWEADLWVAAMSHRFWEHWLIHSIPVKWHRLFLWGQVASPSLVSVLPASGLIKILGFTCLLGLLFRPWNNFLKSPYTSIKTKTKQEKEGKKRKKRKEKLLRQLFFQFNIFTLFNLLITLDWAWALTCRLFTHKRRTG